MSLRPLSAAIALSLGSFLVSSGALAQSTAPTAPTGTAPKKEGEKTGAKGAKDAQKDATATDTAPATAPAPSSSAEVKPTEPAVAEMDDANKEDKQAIYLSGDIGFARVDVGGLSDSTGLDRTGGNGILAGFGVGYRNRGFRVGARFRDNPTTQFTVWSIMGEVGYALPMRPLAPTFMLHAGYMFDTGVERGAFEKKLPPGNFQTPDVDLNGAIVGVEVVASYHLTHFLRVGPFIGFDMLFMHRSQPNAPQSIFQVDPAILNNPLFGESGNGLGYVFSIGVRLTGDIGFDDRKKPAAGEEKK